MINTVNLRKTNNLLLVAIILVNAWVLLLPMWPTASFWLRHHFTHTEQQLETKTSRPTTPTASNSPNIPADNRLVVPSMLLDEPIYDGSSPYTVNKGIWRWPSGSTPDKGGNTVLIGHRFTYSGPAVFYHLDVLKLGDKLTLYWKHAAYYYEVSEIKIVPPTGTSVLQSSADARLTLYTCTPLWTAKNRLVIIAKQVTQS